MVGLNLLLLVCFIRTRGYQVLLEVDLFTRKEHLSAELPDRRAHARLAVRIRVVTARSFGVKGGDGPDRVVLFLKCCEFEVEDEARG